MPAFPATPDVLGTSKLTAGIQSRGLRLVEQARYGRRLSGIRAEQQPEGKAGAGQSYSRCFPLQFKATETKIPSV